MRTEGQKAVLGDDQSRFLWSDLRTTLEETLSILGWRNRQRKCLVVSPFQGGRRGGERQAMRHKVTRSHIRTQNELNKGTQQSSHVVLWRGKQTPERGRVGNKIRWCLTDICSVSQRRICASTPHRKLKALCVTGSEPSTLLGLA